MELLEKINQKENTTIVMVTHDSTIVNNNKKRTIALEEGYIVADIKKGGYIKWFVSLNQSLIMWKQLLIV